MEASSMFDTSAYYNDVGSLGCINFDELPTNMIIPDYLGADDPCNNKSKDIFEPGTGSDDPYFNAGIVSTSDSSPILVFDNLDNLTDADSPFDENFINDMYQHQEDKKTCSSAELINDVFLSVKPLINLALGSSGESSSPLLSLPDQSSDGTDFEMFSLSVGDSKSELSLQEDLHNDLEYSSDNEDSFLSCEISQSGFVSNSDSVCVQNTTNSDKKEASITQNLSELTTANMVAPLHLPVCCKTAKSPEQPKFVELPKLTMNGVYVNPSCGRGKTMHSFGACNPATCTRKSTLNLPRIANCEEIGATANFNSNESIVTSISDNHVHSLILSSSQVEVSKEDNILLEESQSELHQDSPTEILNTTTNFKSLISSDDKYSTKKVPKLITSKPRRIITVKKSEVFDIPKPKSSKRKLEELPFWSMKSRNSSGSLSRKASKCKAYQLDPLPDPKLERCRRNAINAKKNRDAKKELIHSLQQNLISSESENKSLRQRLEILESKVELLLVDREHLVNTNNVNTKLLQKLKQENDCLHQRLQMHCD